MEEAELEQQIVWGALHQADNDWVSLEAFAQPEPWIDPAHRMTALHLVHKMMDDFDLLDNEVGNVDLGDDPNAPKILLNKMFEYADYFVNYIANGEKIPLIGTIET